MITFPAKMLIWVLYLISVLSYTLYGYGKAITEGSCLQGRPGYTQYIFNLKNVGGVRFIDDNSIAQLAFGAGENCYINPSEVKCQVVELNKSNISKVFEGEYINFKILNWNVDENGDFNLSVSTKSRFIDLSCYGVMTLPNDTGEVVNDILETEAPFSTNVYYNSNKSVYGNCDTKISAIDCSVTSSFQLFFLYISLSVMGFAVAVTVISQFSVKVRISYVKALNWVGINTKPYYKFCNPLDYNFYYKNRGEIYFTISKSKKGASDKCKLRMNFVKTDNVSIYAAFKDKTITVIKNNGSEGNTIKVGKKKFEDVRCMIYFLSLSCSNWIAQKDIGHFLGLEDFEEFLLRGEGERLCMRRSKKKILFSDPELIRFISGNSSLPYKICEILYNHNLKFFKKMCLSAVLLVSLKRCGWKDRPEGVGNSEWKRYTNDVYLFMASMGFRDFFVQLKNKKVRMTESMMASMREFNKEGSSEKREKDLSYLEMKGDLGLEEREKAVEEIYSEDVYKKCVGYIQKNPLLESLGEPKNKSEFIEKYKGSLEPRIQISVKETKGSNSGKENPSPQTIIRNLKTFVETTIKINYGFENLADEGHKGEIESAIKSFLKKNKSPFFLSLGKVKVQVNNRKTLLKCLLKTAEHTGIKIEDFNSYLEIEERENEKRKEIKKIEEEELGRIEKMSRISNYRLTEHYYCHTKSGNKELKEAFEKKIKCKAKEKEVSNLLSEPIPKKLKSAAWISCIVKKRRGEKSFWGRKGQKETEKNCRKTRETMREWDRENGNDNYFDCLRNVTESSEEDLISGGNIRSCVKENKKWRSSSKFTYKRGFLKKGQKFYPDKIHKFEILTKEEEGEEKNNNKGRSEKYFKIKYGGALRKSLELIPKAEEIGVLDLVLSCKLASRGRKNKLEAKEGKTCFDLFSVKNCLDETLKYLDTIGNSS